MIAAEQVLNANGIYLPRYAPGRQYTTCPQCSRGRATAAHRKLKVLGVTIDGGSVRWGCNHCGWTGPSKGNGGEGKPLTSYVYRDKGGAILFRKVRNAPGREPRFFLQKWTSLEWAKGTGGVDTSILYRADEVAKAMAAGRSICIVEGEKDADNLWRLGFAATCNAHGAHDPTKRQKPKWYASHSAQLKGAEIVVFNDNDPSGYEHADTTCKLSLGIAKRVRRLDLALHWPDIPPKGDVSDWIAAGHGREELAALIDGAPDYTPRESDGAKPRPGPADVDAPTDDDAELARLARLPPIEYERARADAAQRLGWRTVMLDRLVAWKRAELDGAPDGRPGRPITFEEVEPSDEPVDSAELLTDISEAIGPYVIMDEHRRAGGGVRAHSRSPRRRPDLLPRLADQAMWQDAARTGGQAGGPEAADGEQRDPCLSGPGDREAPADGAN